MATASIENYAEVAARVRSVILAIDTPNTARQSLWYLDQANKREREAASQDALLSASRNAPAGVGRGGSRANYYAARAKQLRKDRDKFLGLAQASLPAAPEEPVAGPTRGARGKKRE